MFKKSLIIPLFLSLFIFFLMGAFFWWRENSKAPSKETKEVAFLIKKGKGASEIAYDLASQGLIKSPLAFKVYIQFKGYSSKIQAGRYLIPQNLTIPEVVEILVKGPKDVWVTIPEGLRREEVVEKLITGLGKNETEASTFRDEFLTATKDLEGFLFPDTYLFPRDIQAQSVISVMRNTFDKRLNEIEKGSHSNLSLKEIVTLASIIERETKEDSEKPIVAGILLNRLEIGMGLQADATVQYAVANSKLAQNSKLNKFWEPLTKKDLTIDSLYNTYKYRGLPPTPIANPGASSLKAAFFPAQTDYFYYLHDPQGEIHYAKTLEEHNKNIRIYLGR